LGSDKASWLISNLVGSRAALIASLVFMVGAGMAGGIIASTLVTCNTFDEFWDNDQGPICFKWSKVEGKRWAKWEHRCFWISLIFFSISILSGTATAQKYDAKLEAVPSAISSAPCSSIAPRNK
jgi:hypothetical protein